MTLYDGRDLAEMQHAGDNAALQRDECIPSSSFTPINRPAPRQLQTPQLSAPSPSLSTDHTLLARHAKEQENRGNLLVDQYLNPGADTGTSKFVPIHASPTPPCRQKRGAKTEYGSTPMKDHTARMKASKRRRISDACLATKPVLSVTAELKGTITPSQPATRDVLYSSSKRPENSKESEASTNQITESWHHRKWSSKKAEASASDLFVPEEPMHHCSAVSSYSTTSLLSSSPDFALQDASTHLHVNHVSQDSIFDDGFDDDVLNMIELDDSTNSTATDSRLRSNLNLQHEERDAHQSLTKCNNSLVEENFFSQTPEMTCTSSSPVRLTRFDEENSKVSLPGPKLSDLHAEDLFAVSYRGRPGKIDPSTTLSILRNRMPITRPPFPIPVRDRSPIVGLSPALLLRTCFRIGEAINQAYRAAKHGEKIMFELYARVLSSGRDEAKQHFVFGDLFHDNPPFVKGTYEAAIWKQVELYNYDSGRLLAGKRMCRCIGTIKRNGKEWVMTVFNAWETTWEDIAWVEGIVSS